MEDDRKGKPVVAIRKRVKRESSKKDQEKTVAKRDPNMGWGRGQQGVLRQGSVVDFYFFYF